VNLLRKIIVIHFLAYNEFERRRWNKKVADCCAKLAKAGKIVRISRGVYAALPVNQNNNTNYGETG
jgi:hypothetical protein